MMDLRELYQDIILDHGRHPRNFRAIPHPTHTAQGHNPLCGDRVTVYLTLDGDHIADVSVSGARLRDLDCGGVADDRGAEGQDRRARRRSCSRSFHAQGHGRRGQPPA